MAEKDYRMRIDLTFPPEEMGVANGLYNHCKAQMAKAINIGSDHLPPEISFISLERCGHRLELPCEEIKREEVS